MKYLLITFMLLLGCGDQIVEETVLPQRSNCEKIERTFKVRMDGKVTIYKDEFSGWMITKDEYGIYLILLTREDKMNVLVNLSNAKRYIVTEE